MEYSSWINTSLDLNLNPSSGVTEEIPKKEVESKFFGLELKSSSSRQERSGALKEELKRVSVENKKMTEMLTYMCENYNTLRTHLSEYMRNNNKDDDNNNNNNNNSEKEMSPSQKRKSDQCSNNSSNPIGVYGNNNNNSESSSNDEEESSNQLKQESNLSYVLF